MAKVNFITMIDLVVAGLMNKAIKNYQAITYRSAKFAPIIAKNISEIEIFLM